MQANYRRLILLLFINAVLMFFITSANLREIDHFHANLNRTYMALMMTAPMGVVMLLVMRSMYDNTRLTRLFMTFFVAMFALTAVLMRLQAPVGNEQFLRSMIPHHSSAILMCEEASISDPEISSLCGEIVESQVEEIARMERILQRY